MLKQLQKVCLASAISFLIACGGGGGGSSNENPSVTVSSASNSSATSSSTIPQNVTATPGNASVALNWSPVTNATNYRIYYATEANVNPVNSTAIQNVTAPHVINNLQNDTTYYFIVTAINGTTESAKSIELSATPSAISLAQQPTAQEVLVVEFINRARFDPTAEATRYGIGLNDGITGSTISTARKQPLAHNLQLIASARNHSQWMLDNDIFSHTGINNSSPGERMAAAGYTFTGSWSSGENIAWGGTTGATINLTQYAATQHEGLFKSPGHRVNILGETFRELGVGQKQGYYSSNGTQYLSSMLTENFARSGSRYFLTGVVYNDLDNDDFYTVGEGLSGISINVNGQSYSVFATGAYSIPVNNGTYNLTISGNALGTTAYYTVQVNGGNVKVDVVKTGNTVDVVSWKM